MRRRSVLVTWTRADWFVVSHRGVVERCLEWYMSVEVGIRHSSCETRQTSLSSSGMPASDVFEGADCVGGIVFGIG